MESAGDNFIIKAGNHRKKKKDLEAALRRNNPLVFVEKITNRGFNRKIIIQDKRIRGSGDFEAPSKVFVDFTCPIDHMRAIICHEIAHLVLRQPPWHDDAKIRKILTAHEGYKSKKYGYNFQYLIEQTVVFFIQAAYEDELGTRALDYKDWEDTFRRNDVLDAAPVMWRGWLGYRKKARKDIDKWILGELGRHWGRRK